MFWQISLQNVAMMCVETQKFHWWERGVFLDSLACANVLLNGQCGKRGKSFLLVQHFCGCFTVNTQEKKLCGLWNRQLHAMLHKFSSPWPVWAFERLRSLSFRLHWFLLKEGCRGRHDEVLHGGAASSEPLAAQMDNLSTLRLCTQDWSKQKVVVLDSLKINPDLFVLQRTFKSPYKHRGRHFVCERAFAMN